MIKIENKCEAMLVMVLYCGLGSVITICVSGKLVYQLPQYPCCV